MFLILSRWRIILGVFFEIEPRVSDHGRPTNQKISASLLLLIAKAYEKVYTTSL